MRFSDNGYYIERYIKCDNCGVLIYRAGIAADIAGAPGTYCSRWCIDWASARAAGVEQPAIPLPRGTVHGTD